MTNLKAGAVDWLGRALSLHQKCAASSTALRLPAVKASSLEVGLLSVGSTKISWMFVNPMKPRICFR